MSVLRIVNLVKKYGKNIVVDHLNLEVHDGEFVTLLGPSGCGKTTTLRALAGLVEIDGGEIYFDDQLMNDVPANKRSASMVFQTYALFPHMTVKDNVAFGLKMQKIDKKERDERALASIELMGLQDLADRKLQVNFLVGSSNVLLSQEQLSRNQNFFSLTNLCQI